MTLARAAQAELMAGRAVALVMVAETEGSTPREVGAQMVVTAAGFHGTIGGGTLEWKALAQAQALLARGGTRHDSQFVLGPDTGQCCGGRVRLATQVFNPGEDRALLAALTPEQPRRVVALFGAGHVGRATMLALAQAPFDLRWVDPRPDAFPPVVPGHVRLYGGDPMAALEGLPSGAVALVMSHSHVLDFAVVDAALRQPAVARVLLIGSATKRARFLSRLRAAGHTDARLADIICPIGIDGIRSKQPYAIAISTAAGLVALDEQLSGAQHSPAAKPRLQEKSNARL